MSSRKSKKQVSRGSRRSNSKRSKASKGRSSRKSAKEHKITLPKTLKIPSKKTKSVPRVKVSRAHGDMSLSDLEFMAKSMGIPFGGLNKTQLIRKINNYF